MSAMLNEHTSMTIGEVLSHLTPDFPDVSISKIRFLESEGLIAPQRAKSGYRRFTPDDVATLRLILTAQRDRYLPLRVIKAHLRAGTLAEHVVPKPVPRPEVEVRTDILQIVPEQQGEREPEVDPREPVTRRDLIARSGLTGDHVDELTDSGVIKADPGGRYAGADVLVCQAFRDLLTYGVEVRHLRMVKNAASRDSALISGAVAHLPDPQQSDAIRTMLDALSHVHYWQVVAELNRQPPGQHHRRRRSK